MAHLLVALTAHGYGHLAQTAPVIRALRKRLPALRLTLWSDLPRELLRLRIPEPFELQPGATDPGMIMHSPLAVNAAASAAAYGALHKEWPVSVKREAARLQAAGPDLMFANVSHLALAAAAHNSVPAVALCSLNWADIYAHCCLGQPSADLVEAQMRVAYRSARWFLQPAPSMPMTDLPRRRPIGPIAAVGRNRKAELCRELGLPMQERWVLVNLGGIPSDLSLARWPRLPGVRWVAPAAWLADRDDGLIQERIHTSFTDLLASCDAVVTKPGYGIFTEAACNGLAVVYAERNDWPEQACLVAWLERHGRCHALTYAALQAGEVAEALEAVWTRPGPERPVATGAEEAASVLEELLER